MAMRPKMIDVVLRSTRAETADIRSFVLEREDGKALPPFTAGAHVDVEPVPGLIRQYSLLGNPNETQFYRIAVKREARSRGGSIAMHSALINGTRLQISAPKNNFALSPTSGRRLLLAGGIGVTPLLSMAHALHDEGADFELHYFIRTSDDLAFQNIFANVEWTKRTLFHFGVIPPALTDLLGIILATRQQDDQIYMCGPSGFMDLISDVALAKNWPSAQIFSEHFSSSPSVLSADGDSFVVRLLSSNQEFVVPSERTIVDVLRDNGIEVVTNCEQGVCGTCVTRCVEGEPDHHDMYLTDDERNIQHLFAPCVSRATSKLLVLDL